MQDNQLIEQLKNGNEEVLGQVYQKHRQEFLTWIIKAYHCEVEDAKDFYQFAVIKLYENVLNNKLTEMTSSVKTYLFAIGKNKVLESRKKAARFELGETEMSEEPQDTADKETKLLTIERCLTSLGEPCNQLLKQYYYERKTMDQIADHFDYSNRDTAKNLKFKCLQRLRKLVREEYKKVA